MSSHVRILTLKFCTCDIKSLTYALDKCGESYEIEGDRIRLTDCTIEKLGASFFIRTSGYQTSVMQKFKKINSMVAEVESRLRELKIEEQKALAEQARINMEMFRVRQIKKEQDQLEYDRRKLELEKQDFVMAKKMAIESKAKAMGYSVKETVEDGKVKLILVKRVYRCSQSTLPRSVKSTGTGGASSSGSPDVRFTAKDA